MNRTIPDVELDDLGEGQGEPVGRMGNPRRILSSTRMDMTGKTSYACLFFKK